LNFSVRYETYHTRILFFERYARTLTYAILAYAYPRALVIVIIIIIITRHDIVVQAHSASGTRNKVCVTCVVIVWIHRPFTNPITTTCCQFVADLLATRQIIYWHRDMSR